MFIGSEGETWNMDPKLLEKAIIDRKEKTGRYPKAIVPVVEDSAEGMGSRFDGKVLGTFGKYMVLSFNGNKMITTSGGGALVSRNA